MISFHIFYAITSNKSTSREKKQKNAMCNTHFCAKPLSVFLNRASAPSGIGKKYYLEVAETLAAIRGQVKLSKARISQKWLVYIAILASVSWSGQNKEILFKQVLT